MTVAAVITKIPILMIYFSRVLKYRLNRLANIIAAIITAVYIIGGGNSAPHYLIIATIEVSILLSIIVISWKWRNPEDAQILPG